MAACLPVSWWDSTVAQTAGLEPQTVGATGISQDTSYILFPPFMRGRVPEGEHGITQLQ